MSWAITATVGATAFGAVQQYSAASASASYSKKQARANDKMNAERARKGGTRIDTNTVRARIETAAAIQGIHSSENEAASQARVAGAALGVGASSADTILDTFAKKANQAESSTIQGLVSELVGNSLQRQDIADNARAGMSTSTDRGPSAAGAILGGVVNYFSSTNGLSQVFGGSSKVASQQVSTDFTRAAGLGDSTLNPTNWG